MVACYVNRALVRLNINNLRGAMGDYDKALELDPDNFLAHYNRGLLRIQVGDDNRAIDDFDYVIRMEPENFMAIYNRALLRHKTGDLRGAIQDYNKILEQFPNFWTGLYRRADCYRRLGMTNQAELDEFKVFKAQMDKHIGIQPRWSKSQARQTRKKSEIDFDKYNQIVVEDEEETVEHEYESVYRGKVQNRKLDIDYMPLYHLSYQRYNNILKPYQVFDKSVERFNQKNKPLQTIYVTCNPNALNEQQSKQAFVLTDSLTALIWKSKKDEDTKKLLLQRAVANTVVQSYGEAIDDLNTYIGIDADNPLAFWQRGVCEAMTNEVSAQQGVDYQIRNASAMSDFNRALELDPSNAYVYYDRGNLYFAQGDYGKAIEDYTRALDNNKGLAEAFFNRGLARIHSGQRPEGVADLSKAGELGLYIAYSMIKKYSK